MTDFVRYLMVQSGAYGVDMGGFMLLFGHFGVNPIVANAISKVLAGVFAFVAHRSFTFGVTGSGGTGQQAFRYFTLLALNIPLSALVFGALLLVIPMAVAAKFLADAICVLLNYWLSKRFIFLNSQPSSAILADSPSKP